MGKNHIRFIGGPEAGKQLFTEIKFPQYRVPDNPDFSYNLAKSTPEKMDFSPEYYVYDLHEIVICDVSFFYAIHEGSDPRHIMNKMWNAYAKLNVQKQKD